MDYQFISIIIPTRNRPSELKRLMNSAVKHLKHDRNFEFIVVDDCSDSDIFEETNHIIKEYQQLFTIKLIKMDKKTTPANCRNIAVANSQGDILYFIDDDCLFIQDNLKQLRSFFRNSNDKIVTGPLRNGNNIYSSWQNMRINLFSYLVFAKTLNFMQKIFFWKNIKQFSVRECGAGNMAILKSTFLKNPFNSTLSICEDTEFCRQTTAEIVFHADLTIIHDHNYTSFKEMLNRLILFDQYTKTKISLRSLILNTIVAILACVFYRRIDIFPIFLKMNLAKSKIKLEFPERINQC